MRAHGNAVISLFQSAVIAAVYALAGLRLGYAVTCNHALIEKIYRHRQPWEVSAPAQSAGIAALAQTEFAARIKSIISSKCRYALLCT